MPSCITPPCQGKLSDMRFALVLLALGLGALADEPKWEQKDFDCKQPSGCDDEKCCQYGLAVYTREKPGVEVKEVKVQTGMAA